MEPDRCPVDSQALKTIRLGGPERGYDRAKRLADRKNFIRSTRTGSS
jgi:hypothetical protein